MTALTAALAVLVTGMAVRLAFVASIRTGSRRPLLRRRRTIGPLRRSRPPRELPDRLEAVARALRGGASLPSAVLDTAPAGPDPLGGLARRIESGYSVRDAVVTWPDVRRDPSVRLAAAGLLAAGVVGGPQARIVDAVALSLRERAAEAAERRAQAAQARASASVLVALPVVVGGWSAITNRRVGVFLLTTPTGLACAATGVLLILLGAIWMRRLVRSEP